MCVFKCEYPEADDIAVEVNAADDARERCAERGVLLMEEMGLWLWFHLWRLYCLYMWNSIGV